MIQINLSQDLKATANEVATELLKHPQLDRFFNGHFRILQPQASNHRQGGQGTIREVRMGRHTFHEEIVSATDNHISYRIVGKGPVSQHQGDIYLHDEGTIGCTLNYQIRCKGPRFVPGFIVKHIIKNDIKLGLGKLARFFHER